MAASPSDLVRRWLQDGAGEIIKGLAKIPAPGRIFLFSPSLRIFRDVALC